MDPLPVQDLRSNCGTWAVPTEALPALANQLIHALPTEGFDPNFRGQALETTYFDTRNFALRRARVKAERYLTLRIRCYGADPAVYALSAKTESQKFRAKIPADLADVLLTSQSLSPGNLVQVLAGDLLAQLQQLAGDAPLLPVVTVGFRRYAVESPTDRLTLDVGIRTDTGKGYPAHVLEYKSTSEEATPPLAICFRPIKLSKFLWATGN